MGKYVYSFSEGNKDMRELLGGKGANLCEMMHLGLPIPKGFIVTTESCNIYYQNKEKMPKEITLEIMKNLHKLELLSKRKINDPNSPLLVSVRSGARASMPGMMDTILNLGLNDALAASWSEKCQNKRFVYDSYRRLIMMYADVVKGLDKNKFESILEKYKKEKNVLLDQDLNGDDLEVITKRFKKLYKKELNESFPENIEDQLIEAVTAVFRSWNNNRAKVYRKMNNIPDEWGTAVNVQLMVYGNINDLSGTGVAFSRNPATGKNELYGEFMMNAQGEDLVAGIRTPQSIINLKKVMPEIYDQFAGYAKKLEKHFKDMQDIEFTIENGELYLLQTRSGKRTPNSAIKIAVDLYKEKLITKEEAILRIDEKELENILHKTFKPSSLKNYEPLFKGLPASPGAESGAICFHTEDAKKFAEDNQGVILVRNETSPEDIEGMAVANAVVTVRGGMTSHAAVVARGMGKCCVCGCEGIKVDEKKKTLIVGKKSYKEGVIISVDGQTGLIYEGKIEEDSPKLSGEFKEFMELVYDVKRLKVRANAETVSDIKTSIDLGCEGVGLVRTEHMFFEPNKLIHFRKMIMAGTKEERIMALKEIMKLQKKDFMKILKELNGMPITVRYLDPPLHEFLPKTKKEIKEYSDLTGIKALDIEKRINELKEFNPMMGLRGARLLISYPEIIEIQTEALLSAAISLKEKDINSNIEIMIPLIHDVSELKYIKDIINKKAKELFKTLEGKINYKVGTMIELPRACIKAQEIAMEADFFSFGSNDLTQMTYGFSRDDCSKFLDNYYANNLLKFDPFQTLDISGVGELIILAVNNSRCVRKNIKLGICGEHGGDAKTVEFCHNIGLNYVSCSAYRIPIAALSAAKAEIKSRLNI